jgi:hypothetical protein
MRCYQRRTASAKRVIHVPRRAVSNQQPNPVQRLAVGVCDLCMESSDRMRKYVGQVFPSWIGFEFVTAPAVEHFASLARIAVMCAVNVILFHVPEPEAELAFFERSRRREPAAYAVPHKQPSRRAEPSHDFADS